MVTTVDQQVRLVKLPQVAGPQEERWQEERWQGEWD